MKANIPPAVIKRPQRPPSPSWQYYLVATVCCALIVAGFLLAARQHFSSMEYGLQNSKLRRQLDDLQSENRRLLLNREVAVSPVELRKAVKRIGFIDTPSSEAEIERLQQQPAQKSVIKAVETVNPAAGGHDNKVLKTVINAPVNRPPASDKQARKDSTVQKKDRT